MVGDRCNYYTKAIGLTLDDILRDRIQRNTSLNHQSYLVKISIALTMLIFVGGSINGAFSILTFQNKDVRKVGCGVYLLTSSITSLLTICMFTIKFWFVVLIQMASHANFTVLRGGCIFIEPLLKIISVFGWLVERMYRHRTSS